MAQVLPEVAMFANVLENMIGFPTAVERARIIAGGITSLRDLSTVKEKDLHDTLSEYEKKPTAQRVSFGMAHVNKMVGLRLYVQDCDRICLDYEEGDITPEALIKHMSHAAVRKSIADHEKTHADMATPGQFKDEKNWVPWHNQLEVFLGGLLGVTGVPLLYVICKQEEPDFETEFKSFLDEQAARAPLQGPTFQADNPKVHNHIMSAPNNGSKGSSNSTMGAVTFLLCVIITRVPGTCVSRLLMQRTSVRLSITAVRKC
jgi:hypothetical protein